VKASRCKYWFSLQYFISPITKTVNLLQVQIPAHVIKPWAINNISASNGISKARKVVLTQIAVMSTSVITVPLTWQQTILNIRLCFALIVMSSSPLHNSNLDHYFNDVELLITA